MNQTPDIVISVILGVIILTMCVFYEWIGELTSVVKSHEEQLKDLQHANHTRAKGGDPGRNQTE